MLDGYFRRKLVDILHVYNTYTKWKIRRNSENISTRVHYKDKVGKYLNKSHHLNKFVNQVYIT